MKFTNKIKRTIILLTVSAMLCGCGGESFDYAYSESANLTPFSIQSVAVDNNRMTPFAASLCVADKDIVNSAVDTSTASSALLFDIKNKKAIYAKNVNERLHPASLTKVMTAIVAIENGSPDMVLTATNNTLINTSGAQVCGLKPGDTLTLEQALNILLVYSANDVAMLIAEGIGGNVANFVDMMNSKAKALGATNTHFMNPHGLTEDDHYTSAYDMYLMFNEALKLEKFTEIIQKSSYQTTYTDKNGKTREFTGESTNRLTKGAVKAPENVTVIGGKTGTTKAAGSCLIICVKDINGNPYIAEILNSDDSDKLYLEMVSLLQEITK